MFITMTQNHIGLQGVFVQGLSYEVSEDTASALKKAGGSFVVEKQQTTPKDKQQRKGKKK